MKTLKKIFNRRNIILLIVLVIGLALYFLTSARYISLMVIFPVLLLLGSLAVMLGTGRSITSEINCPSQGVKGQTMDVSVSLKNNGLMPIMMCTFDAKAENLLTGQVTKHSNKIAIGRGKTETFTFPVKDNHLGCVTVTADNVRVSDPFRIFMKRPKELIQAETFRDSIYFMPPAVETVITPEDLSSYDMESYKYSPVQKGYDPAETFDIRSYESGDSIKSIHWKLSSKMDDLVIREHGLPIENRVMIIVDKLEKADTPAIVDKRTEFAAAVSYTLMKQKVVHSIGWYNTVGEKFESFRVDNEGTYWAAVKAMVSCPYRQEEQNSVDRFLASGYDDSEFLSYIYISETGRGIENLYSYGSVKQYRAENF